LFALYFFNDKQKHFTEKYKCLAFNGEIFIKGWSISRQKGRQVSGFNRKTSQNNELIINFQFTVFCQLWPRLECELSWYNATYHGAVAEFPKKDITLTNYFYQIFRFSQDENSETPKRKQAI